MRRSLEGGGNQAEEHDQIERQQSPRTEPPAQYDEFSKALWNLSFNDRNAIIEEIHGVTCMAPDESPEFLNAALYSLNHELNQIEDKSAYNLAQEIYRSNNYGADQCAFVNTDKFRLRFLRSELFDVKKAAARMVKYLDLVCEAYGEYALIRPFRLSDLTREEMSFLRGGDYQLLPYRDRSGRRILCIVTNNRDDIPAKTRLKVLIYLWVVAADDVESQRNGMIVISYSGPKITTDESGHWVNSKKHKKFHQSRVKTHVIVVSAVPMRVTAVHFCLPLSTLVQVFTQIYKMAMGPWSSRVKFHMGESIELRYQLKGYGIPVELIPATDTGNVKQQNLKQWIKLREYVEMNPHSLRRVSLSSNSDDAMDYEHTSSSIPQGYVLSQQQQQYYQMQYIQQYQIQQQEQQQLQHQQQQDKICIVECPGSCDVVFRRGKSMMYHPGNAMFQSLIQSRLEEHDNTNQAGRIAIVISLIQYIEREKGGRFLTWDSKNNWWLDMMTIPMSGSHYSPVGIIQAQELEIQAKVSYAFRDFKKKMKTQQDLQVSLSSTYAFERQDGSGKKRSKGGSGSSCIDVICSDSSENAGDLLL